MMGEIVLISHCNLLNVFSLMWSLSLFFLVGKGLCKQRENFFIEIKIEKSSPCLREGPRYFKINIIKLLLKQYCRTRVFHPWEDSRRVGKRFAGGLACLAKPLATLLFQFSTIWLQQNCTTCLRRHFTRALKDKGSLRIGQKTYTVLSLVHNSFPALKLDKGIQGCCLLLTQRKEEFVVGCFSWFRYEVPGLLLRANLRLFWRNPVTFFYDPPQTEHPIWKKKIKQKFEYQRALFHRVS